MFMRMSYIFQADKLLKALSEYAAVQQKDVGTIRAKTPKTKKKDVRHLILIDSILNDRADNRVLINHALKLMSVVFIGTNSKAKTRRDLPT